MIPVRASRPVAHPETLQRARIHLPVSGRCQRAVPIMDDPKIGFVADAFLRLKPVLEWGEENVAVDAALDQGQIKIGTKGQRLLVDLGAPASIWRKSETVCTPGHCMGDRLSTIVVRCGSARPIDSKVLRPRTTTCP